TGARIHLCRAVRNRDRPEQAGRAESRVEVVQLMRKVKGRRPFIDVESNEAEGGVLVATGEVDVLAFHDAHVDVERLIAELAAARTDRVGGRNAAIEVENGRRVARAEEVEVEVRTEDVGRARDSLWSSGCAPCGSQQRDAGGGQGDTANAGRSAGDECPA